MKLNVIDINMYINIYQYILIMMMEQILTNRCEQCAVCHENKILCATRCSHEFCETCILNINQATDTCPLCRLPNFALFTTNPKESVMPPSKYEKQIISNKICDLTNLTRVDTEELIIGEKYLFVFKYDGGNIIIGFFGGYLETNRYIINAGKVYRRYDDNIYDITAVIPSFLGSSDDFIYKI
jgi:hypothetical protein